MPERTLRTIVVAVAAAVAAAVATAWALWPRAHPAIVGGCAFGVVVGGWCLHQITRRYQRQEATYRSRLDTVSAGTTDVSAVATTIEASMRSAALGLDEVRESVSELQQQLRPFTATAGADGVPRWLVEGSANLAAHAALLALVDPRAPLPLLGGWALNADVLHLVACLMWQRRPGLIVECGSGSSSIWLGYLAARLGHGRVVALEHDEQFLRRSRDLVRMHDMEKLVEIRYAPLEPWPDPQGGAEYLWYRREAISDLTDIGLLLVDGPPGATCPNARYPAGPLLIPRCSTEAVVVLDDTGRDEERAVSSRWLQQWPELVRTEHGSGKAHAFQRGDGDG